MGAVSYSKLVLVKGDANAAYSQAREDARDMNGHRDGYSGDIQTSHGFRKRTDNPRYGTKAFEQWEEKIDEDMDKGDCYCVEVTGAVATRIKHRRGYKGLRGVRVFYFFGSGRN